MKILHSADWHLDSPLVGFTQSQQQHLRRVLLELPGKIAQLALQEQCQLMLLSGDLFDGVYTQESYHAVYKALEEVQIPVFISPGNHDFLSADSPWKKERWPENVTVFTQPHMVASAVSEPRCWVCGAGYTSMDAPAMLEGFCAKDGDVPTIGVLHADPTQVNSPYCPITKKQIADSGLAYLALGHIHKQGSLKEGNTLCAWPGCPMGRGYDEQGEKGVLLVTVEETVTAQFVSLDTPRFYDLEAQVDGDPEAAIARLLPATGNEDFYRITLTGSCQTPDLAALEAAFAQFSNLKLRDRTVLPVDTWSAVGEDSFEGVYFSLLQKTLEDQDAEQQQITQLAARISRQILDGREVRLP